jgi:hypothetical protein
MTRLAKLGFAATLLSLGLTGCVEVKAVAYESVFCSVDKDESPFYSCDKSRSNLVCIQTYTVGEKMQKVNLCRVICDTRADCSNSGDVCCAGPIYGETYGKTKACVPRDNCKTDPAALLEPSPPSKNDGGTRDTGGMTTPTGDIDASEMQDAPLMSLIDAGVDAISADSGSDI